MKAAAWEKSIIEQCKAVGTMKPAFKATISTLADILEQRDATYQQFVQEGSRLVIERVSDRGAVNSAKNPLYVIWNELNSQALAYWRDLGLTPKGLKAISEEALKPEKTDPFVDKIDQLLGR